MLQKSKKILTSKWFVRTAGFLILWIIIHIIYISVDGCTRYTGRADVAVILGNHVFADGSLSPWLKGRVDKALDLYRQGRVIKIYASGGISKNAEGDYPEGDAMKNYLLSRGVPASAVVADNGGQNTFLTAKDFIGWNRSQHFSSAVVVSQFYHITRSKYIIRKLGFTNVSGASSESYSANDIVSTLREVPAFYKYLLVY